jgi:hypothetical protein
VNRGRRIREEGDKEKSNHVNQEKGIRCEVAVTAKFFTDEQAEVDKKHRNGHTNSRHLRGSPKIENEKQVRLRLQKNAGNTNQNQDVFFLYLLKKNCSLRMSHFYRQQAF